MPYVESATRIGEYKMTTQQNERRIDGKFIGVDRAEFSHISFWRLEKSRRQKLL